ncbi:MAG: monooxygenase [Myxococcota bacterium]
MRLLRWSPLLWVVAAACADRRDVAPACSDERASVDAGAGLTYLADVEPILLARCKGCHVAGGAGPFPLTTYQEVFAKRHAVRQAVEQRAMPPWLPAKCCNEYLFDRSMSDAEVAIVTAWIDQGAPEGTAFAEPGPAPSVGLSRVDVRASMPEPYVPKPPTGTSDDMRCFVLDWPAADTRFVTGVNIIPGRRELVHHVILAIASGDDLSVLDELDERSEGPGFDCNGGFARARVTGTIGGWEPGGPGLDFPDGLGVRVEGGAKLILNIHYSVAYSPPAPDQTVVELKVDETARPFRTVTVANPMWLVDGAMTVKAGASDVPYSYQFDPTGLFGRGKAMKLYSANIHMHEYAFAGTLGVVRQDGSRECLLHIPRWDLHWQGYYWFKEPTTLRPGDQLFIECRFNNSPSNPAVAAGTKQRVPHDIDWGEDEDMCAGFFNFVEAE